MKFLLTLFALSIFSLNSFAQYEFEPNQEYPFGQLNPAAFPQTADYAPLIGVSECTSQNRAPDGTWNEEVDMLWKWKYIMNGNAIQDETLKTDGLYSGSIRQFNADSARWFVHYYSSGTATATLGTWEGGKTEDGNIVLYRDQKSPNGLAGFFRLTFSEITKKNFKWIGEWVNTDETIVYPTWKITCTKKES